MTRGRKPVPTELKLLRGNPGKRRIPRNEPKPTNGAPNCPTWLSLEAKAEWKRVVPVLDELKLLTQVDRAALATYCESWATFVWAQREIHKYGLIVMVEKMESIDGLSIYVQPTKNPAIQVARDAADKVRQFCAEFGLTPSARTRLQMPEGEGDAAGFAFS